MTCSCEKTQVSIASIAQSLSQLLLSQSSSTIVEGLVSLSGTQAGCIINHFAPALMIQPSMPKDLKGDCNGSLSLPGVLFLHTRSQRSYSGPSVQASPQSVLPLSPSFSSFPLPTDHFQHSVKAQPKGSNLNIPQQHCPYIRLMCFQHLNSLRPTDISSILDPSLLHFVYFT